MTFLSKFNLTDTSQEEKHQQYYVTTENDEEIEVAIPNEIYNWRMVLVAITAAFAAVIIGYDAGFIGGTVALASFQEEFGIDKMTAEKASLISANIVSVFQAGAFWGAIFFYPVGELIGRKVGLIISGFFLVLGAGISLESSSSHHLASIYAGRVLTGIGVGGCSGLAPIYISESSPTLIRGKLVGMWEISWQVGGVVGYWINYGVLQHIPSTRAKQWLIPFAIQLVPSGLFFFGTFFIPESPRYLVFRNKLDKAKTNLSFLRNLPEDDPYLNHEFGNIVRDIEVHKAKLGSDSFFAPFRKVFFQKKIVVRLLLSTSLFVMQNGSGINAITYYSPTVFKSFGLDGTNAGLQSTGIFGLLKAFASLVWLFYIVERFGRKTALVWCSLPCSICMWYIGAYIKIDNPAARVAAGDIKQNAGGRAAQAMLYIWTIFYGISWNGTPWVINSEIFSQEIRTLTQAINACSNWFWAFVMGRWSGQALNAIGYKFYFIFATCMVVFPVIVFFLYPETKGVPLEAIDHLFFKVPAWKSREYALEQYRIEYESKLADSAAALLSGKEIDNEKYTISEESDVGVVDKGQ